MVDILKHEYPVTEICEVLDAPRRTHYNRASHEPSGRQLANEALLVNVHRVHTDSRSTYGSRRVTRELRRKGGVVNKKRIERLMHENAIVGAMKKKRRPRTTDSDHSNLISPNLLKLEGPPERPNAVWVADITYIATSEGWWYLATVMDLFSRMVKGWSFGPRIDAALVKDAFAMAVRRHGVGDGIFHHSDRGSQYTAHEFKELLSSCGVRSSNSAKGNCYDNAAEESFWATLKTEAGIDSSMTPGEIRVRLFDYIELFYNTKRLHSGIGYRTPLEVEAEYATPNVCAEEETIDYDNGNRRNGSGQCWRATRRGITGQGDGLPLRGSEAPPTLSGREKVNQSLLMPYKLTSERDNQVRVSDNQGNMSTTQSMDKS